MQFFFVKDHRNRYRYFSSDPSGQIQVRFSRWKNLWEKAKKKLMLLPQKILAKEQAFAQVSKLEGDKIEILHSGMRSKKRIKRWFSFYLQKQRTKHILFLASECLLLPISGLAALLPGPNVFFGVLALLMITHWQALRGINRLLKEKHYFVSAPLLKEWEEALKTQCEESYSEVLEKITRKYGLQSIRNILWK